MEGAGTATSRIERWVEFEPLQSIAATPERGVQLGVPASPIPAGRPSTR